MSTPRYPALFQVNTRVRLSELAAALSVGIALGSASQTMMLVATLSATMAPTADARRGSWGCCG